MPLICAHVLFAVCVSALAMMARRVLSPHALCSDATAQALVGALREAASHTDPGGIFPTHLMPGGAADVAVEALRIIDA